MGRGRAPCCVKVGLNKGSWTPEEDMRLVAYIQRHGHPNWRALPKQAGLLRCGKSCRLRWINYLRPDIKRGNFTAEEEETIIKLHDLLGNKWSKIAGYLPGRTDNEIKNVWNTYLKKKLSSEDHAKPAAKSGKGKAKAKAAVTPAAAPISSVTPSSSTSTACSSSASPSELSPDGDGKIEIPFEPDIDISDMFVDDNITPGQAPPLGSQFPGLTASPCSSLSEALLTREDQQQHLLVDLPEIDIEPDLWTMIDDGGAGVGGGIVVPPAPSNTGEQEWLQSLERELGLVGELTGGDGNKGVLRSWFDDVAFGRSGPQIWPSF